MCPPVAAERAPEGVTAFDEEVLLGRAGRTYHLERRMALVLRRCPASQLSHQDQPAIGVPLQARALEVLYRPPVLGKHLGQWVAEDRQAAVDVEEGAED